MVAYDRKGSIGESDPIQLSIISREIDLSSIDTIKLKGHLVKGLQSLAGAADARVKEHGSLNNSLRNREGYIGQATSSDLRKSANALAEEANLLYDKAVTTLIAMPRGADSQEVAFLARLFASTARLHSRDALGNAETFLSLDNQTQRNAQLSKLSARVTADKGLLGNVRNVAVSLISHHARAVGTSYMRQLLKNQSELIERAKGEYHLKLAARRQGVALSHWRAIETVFEAAQDRHRISYVKAVDQEEIKLKLAMETDPPDRVKIAHQITSWTDRVNRFNEAVHGLLRQDVRSSFRVQRQSLYWNIKNSWSELKALADEVDQLEKTQNEDRSLHARIMAEHHWPAIVADLEARARIEEARKDADSPFVKDLGQTGRVLDRLLTNYRSQLAGDDAPNGNAEQIKQVVDLFALLETYHEVVEAAGLASSFAHKEKWEMVKASNRGERVRHWAAASAPWSILAGHVALIPIPETPWVDSSD